MKQKARILEIAAATQVKRHAREISKRKRELKTKIGQLDFQLNYNAHPLQVVLLRHDILKLKKELHELQRVMYAP